ncbi:hypothetical protein GCM10010343_19360 [Streptomyces avidinii]|nr:hypothetical protein GCM10010343_19360 [Streptomyces avidinii]
MAGSAFSDPISFSTSQLTVSLVPVYTPGAEPLTLLVPTCAVGLTLGLTCAVPVPWGEGGRLSGVGLWGGGVSFTATESVKGSGPEAATGWRNTSPPALLDVPVGRVRTTARATTATTATSAVTSRGTDRHQGPLAGPWPWPWPPGPPGGAGGGGGGGPCCPPESGPEGGPVGRSEDGGRPDGCVVTGSSSQEDGVPWGPLCAPSGWWPQAEGVTVAG